MKVNSYKYLYKLQNIVSLIAKEQNIEEEEVRQILDHFFKWLKRVITDPRMPTIKIFQFGSFTPQLGKINRWVRLCLHHKRKGNINAAQLRKRLKKVWEVRSRLIEEKQGKETWRKWKKINPKEFGVLPDHS